MWGLAGGGGREKGREGGRGGGAIFNSDVTGTPPAEVERGEAVIHV